MNMDFKSLLAQDISYACHTTYSYSKHTRQFTHRIERRSHQHCFLVMFCVSVEAHGLPLSQLYIHDICKKAFCNLSTQPIKSGLPRATIKYSKYCVFMEKNLSTVILLLTTPLIMLLIQYKYKYAMSEFSC